MPVCKVCTQACVCVKGGLMSLFALDNVCYFFFVCLGTRASKENRHRLPQMDSTAAGRSQSRCLSDYVIISCFLSKQEKTGRKIEPRKVLPLMYVSQRTVTPLARKNRPIQGVTHSGILHGVIFITFTWHSEGCFSQLLTQVWVIFISKTVQGSERGRRPSWPCPFGCQPDTIVVSV